MKIVELEPIKRSINFALDLDELIHCQKAAFVDYSEGLYQIPSPMQFILPEYSSDCHIKGGHRKNSKNLVIKIANGSLFGANGVLLVFAAETGAVRVILHDEGFLTTLRTAIAGIIVSELLPWQVKDIGIIGSGNLAQMLYELVGLKYPDANIMLYARNKNKAKDITHNLCHSAEELVDKCDVVFTATSSNYPIIQDINSNNNQAIIALGSDDMHKRELSIDIFNKSDLVIVDSKKQAMQFGDVAQAIGSGLLTSAYMMELGAVLKKGIPDGVKTIIADFSGIGAQDVAMAEFMLEKSGWI